MATPIAERKIVAVRKIIDLLSFYQIAVTIIMRSGARNAISPLERLFESEILVFSDRVIMVLFNQVRESLSAKFYLCQGC